MASVFHGKIVHGQWYIVHGFMNKIIYSRFDKAKIAELPRVTFPGRIVTILSAGEAEKAVDFLLKSDILGFDTETRPCFTKGKRNKVALLQVSNREICFLFRLNSIGLAPAIVRLLETEGPLKIGLSWHDDIRSLHERGDFEPHGFIDLQDHMIELGIKDMSLAKLYANLFHQRISKREQLSNWEADVLTDKQKLYGATDAWACIQLYEEYVRLKESNDYFLEFVVSAAWLFGNQGIPVTIVYPAGTVREQLVDSRESFMDFYNTVSDGVFYASDQEYSRICELANSCRSNKNDRETWIVITENPGEGENFIGICD